MSASFNPGALPPDEPEMRRRQDTYLASSHPVVAEFVANWPRHRRLWNNTIAMLGSVL